MSINLSCPIYSTVDLILFAGHQDKTSDDEPITTEDGSAKDPKEYQRLADALTLSVYQHQKALMDSFEESNRVKRSSVCCSLIAR